MLEQLRKVTGLPLPLFALILTPDNNNSKGLLRLEAERLIGSEVSDDDLRKAGVPVLEAGQDQRAVMYVP